MNHKALRAILIADATVSALIGERVEPGHLGQDPELPMVTYRRISGRHPVTQTGATGLNGGRYLLECHAETYTMAHELGKAVRDALHGYKGTVAGVKVQGAFVDDDTDVYQSTSEAWTVQVDLTIWCEEE